MSEVSTSIASMIKTDAGYLDVTECSASLVHDEFYIEGAILCTIDGIQLLGYEHADLIDQLWAYIVEGLGQLIEHDGFAFHFPDQPLLLDVRRVSGGDVVVAIGNQSCSVQETSLVTGLADGAVLFFQEMVKLVPNAASTWHRYREDALAIRARFS